MFYISRVALLALLSFFVALAVVPLRSQKKDPCAPILARAAKYVEHARAAIWIGSDASRPVSELLTDYLVCKENQ
jgi:hypothetical protein